ARISSEVKRAPRRQKQAIWAEIRPIITKNPYRNTLNQPRVIFSGKHYLTNHLKLSGGGVVE
nr:hypothetical protein [Bacteroidota bacterium]